MNRLTYGVDEDLLKNYIAKTNKKISRKTIIQWLSHQLLWLRHLPGPKHIDYPHYDITKPNQIHQADVM